jgi:hypothetical protein
MTQAHLSAPGKLTSRWLLPELLSTSACLVVVFFSSMALAQPEKAALGPEQPAYPRDLEALRAELKAQADANAKHLTDELAKLQKQLAEERAQRDAERAEARALADNTKKALDQSSVVRAKGFGLTLSGFVHADVAAWKQSSQDQLTSTGDPINETRFSIRRARLKAELDYKFIGGALELDGNTTKGAAARLIGAEVSFKWRNPDPTAIPYLQLTIGLFKTPFGFEVIQSDKERLFLERSNIIRALFPGEYDLGARLSGGWKFLRYSVAAMNGDPLGEKQFPGRDPNESKDFMGRIGVDLRVLRRLGLAAGFSGLYGTGFHKGVAATKDTLVWNDANENSAVDTGEISVVFGKAAEPSKNFSRYAMGGDLRLLLQLPVVGELMLYGEIIYANNLDRATLVSDPVAAGHDQRQFGFYVGLTQELTRYGMVGVRYDRYDPDRDANQLKGGLQVPKDGSYSTLAVAAAIRYPGYGRLIIEYDHNTNSLGRDKTGAPATLADDALTLRGEVTF